jgi:hypothetical protein
MAEETPQAGAAQEPQPLTVGALREMVHRRAGAGDIERGQTCVWLGGRTLQIDEPSPFNEKYLIVSLFQDERSIQVYEVPVKDPTLHPRRVTLEKAADTMFVEIMSLPRLVDLMTEEVAMLEDGTTTADRELARVLGFIETLHPGTTVGTLAARLVKEEHREEEEDEEEEGEPEPGPNGETIPSPAPGGE